ncbi:EbsA family protein [Apilactobacillus apisilvae]|uniref:EbsA family protein n=1 Tax=Apilactobacillus apisilvae TaxID=2923364 RepID=A0ABY4PKA3_9LACO|nr:EbsA family protein [Apilactobacillus apisilvae]
MWSWTFALLFVGIIFWLEITHFQQITLFFILLFGIFSLFQIMFRKITFENNVITISNLLDPRWISININDIDKTIFTKHCAKMEINGKNYEFLLPANSIIEIDGIINKKAN